MENLLIVIIIIIIMKYIYVDDSASSVIAASMPLCYFVQVFSSLSLSEAWYSTGFIPVYIYRERERDAFDTSSDGRELLPSSRLDAHQAYRSPAENSSLARSKDASAMH